ncbi:MAG TPA: GDSL-type esterase/lipase family protein [Bacteroidia bacterium]|jgi:hypothetical protein
MKANNRLREPFIIVITAVLVLTALSFSKTEFIAGNYTTKKVDLFSDVKFSRHIINYVYPSLLFTDQLKDSLAKIKKEKERVGIADFSNDSAGGMIWFYRALEQGKKSGKQTRVAYFGDSFVEGDLVTMDLRSSLQNIFGGRGVGFVPITSIVAGFRTTITHSFSSDWTKYDFNNGGGSGHPVGPSGNVFIPSAGSWVKYTAPKAYGDFGVVKLYYGTGNETAKLSVKMDDNVSEFNLNGTESINELVLNASGSVHSLTLTFDCPQPVNIYGASFENASGVYVDNYAFRGNSGLPLSNLSLSVCQGFDAHFDYDLVVLHYGLNVVGHGMKNYDWYRKGLENIVDHIRAAFPHASVLVVSLGDKGYRTGDEWNTEPDVVKVIKVQQEVAEEKNVAFWNMYENMGGYNSMKHWVEGDTVLANKDYCHPNYKGAKRIAGLLFDKIMLGFKEYELKEGGL